MSREKWLNSMTEWMDTLDHHLQESLQIFQTKMKGKLIPIHIFETDSELLVEATLPGYTPEQLSVEIVGDKLKIVVETLNTQKDGERCGEENTKIERTIPLPYLIIEEATKASYSNGVLTINVPKKNASRKFISIR